MSTSENGHADMDRAEQYKGIFDSVGDLTDSSSCFISGTYHDGPKLANCLIRTQLKVLNFMRCLSTWKITKIMKIYPKRENRQKMSKFEILRIEFAWCGNCSHTLWEYFAHYDAFPTAI